MKKPLTLFLTAAIIVISLAACTPAAPRAEAPASVTTIEATLQLVAETEEAAPAEEISAEKAATDACVDCHVDKDRLVDTADPVVEEVEESKGAG